MFTHKKDFVSSGVPLKEASKAIVAIHGRGASPEGIISLASSLRLENTNIVAPRAENSTWYPYSFIAPDSDNQPALGSALQVIGELVEDIQREGIALENIYFLGFSQGACLAIEYAARHAARYGGIIVFTGGLIGEQVNRGNYSGDFSGTPILITTGDPDSHVPLARVEETVAVLEEMNARVTLKVYKGRPHSVQREEVELANKLVQNQ